MPETTTPPPTAADTEKQLGAIAMTGISTVLTAAPGTEPSWAKPAVAILALVIFAALIVYAHVTNSAADMQMLDGGAMAMAGTAVSYYLGSSSGSAHKTSLLAAAPAIPTAPPAA